MSDDSTAQISVERLLGGELAMAAEKTLVGVWFGAFSAEFAARLATAHRLLKLYWDLRHRRLTPPAAAESLVALINHRLGLNGGSLSEPSCAERQAVSAGINATVWVEHLLGGELSPAAGDESADPSLSGPALAIRLATAQVLLALYWELRHQRPEQPPVAGDDGSLEWMSALLCFPAGFDYGPDDLAVPGRSGAPCAGLGIHHL
jgi:hypothetical protein